MLLTAKYSCIERLSGLAAALITSSPAQVLSMRMYVASWCRAAMSLDEADKFVCSSTWRAIFFHGAARQCWYPYRITDMALKKHFLSPSTSIVLSCLFCNCTFKASFLDRISIGSIDDAWAAALIKADTVMEPHGSPPWRFLIEKRLAHC